MIKNHKWKAIISSVVILLPMLFGLLVWEQLPSTMISHWGGDGVADGTAPKTFMVFGLPLIMLALQWLMLLLTAFLDKKPQSNKITKIYYGIIPVASLVVNFSVYSVALDKEWNLFVLIPVFVGVMFAFIGNYLPKTTRNRTMGIKLRWTMGNDENWNKTHRLGGKIWFWGGLVIIATALLPFKVTVAAMIAMILVSTIVPTVYSYSIYRKHKAEGIAYEPVFNQKSDKVAKWITVVTVPLVLLMAAVLMFTGNIEVTFTETDIHITASYMDDLTISYEEVESVEYRDTFDVGVREMGFGSPRLSMGTFKNEEFGRYTIYAYTQGEGAVVLKQGNKVIVIVAKTAEETRAIYNAIAGKVLVGN